MMIPKIVLDALQEQHTRERQNAETYDALASACAVAYWPGSAAWFGKQAEEERAHAAKIREYMIGRDAVPMFYGLDAVTPVLTAENLGVAYLSALSTERETTEAIKTLHYTAEAAEDPQTCAFLVWFLNEQTESESILRDFLTMLDRLDANGKLLFDNGMK